MKKEREKEEKKKKEISDKTHVKIPLWSLNNRKKSTKTGKNFRRGPELARTYTPEGGLTNFCSYGPPHDTLL